MINDNKTKKQLIEELGESRQRVGELESLEAETDYRALVEDRTELFCRFLPDLTLTFVNEGYCRCFAKRSEKLIGKSFISRVFKDDQKHTRKYIASMGKENSVLTCDHRVIMPGGRIRWYRWTHRAIFDEEGRVIEFQSVGLNVTDRKQVEDALVKAHENLQHRVEERTAELLEANTQLVKEIQERKEIEIELKNSEEQFRNLVQNSLVGIAIVRDNRIVFQNPEYGKLFKGFPKEFDFKDFDFIHPDDVEKVKELYTSLLSDKAKKVQADFRFYPPDKMGNKVYLRWVHSRANWFNYQNGEAILISIMDLTRAKELEHLVIIKNKMLTLGRIAAGMAHEIRNPLTGINSYVYTLEDLFDSESYGPDQKEMARHIIGQIQVASNKIEAVIKRVLDFSRPGEPKMVFADVNQCLEEAIELSAVTMRKSGIKTEQSLAQDLPKCYLDPPLMEQVILNLMTNAAKAMEKTDGSKMIELATYSRDNSIFIRISDSGPGVPSEIRTRIFDPFFTTEIDGSGIGLSISHRIIADHNGSIDVDTSKWGGAEFIIELPIERRMDTR